MMDLRPLGIGEMLDRSFTVWRAHWKPLFGLYLALALPQYAAMKGIEFATKEFFGGIDTGDPRFEKPIALAAQVVGIVIVGFVGAAFHQVISVAICRLLQSSFDSSPPVTRSEALAFSWSRVGTTLGSYFLGLSLAAGLLMLVVFPFGVLAGASSAALGESRPAMYLAFGLLGFGALIAAMGVVLWYVMRFALAPPILAMESLDAFAVLRRTGALTSGRVGEGLLGSVRVRLTLLLSVIGIVLVVVGTVSATPTIIVRAIYGGLSPSADANAVPLALLVPTELLNLVVQSLVVPVWTVCTQVFYFDMRVRREGLDLELQAAPKP